MSYNIFGVCLLILGLAVLFATLNLGYGLYTAVMQAGSSPAAQKPANVTLSNATSPTGAIIGAVVSEVTAQVPIARYMSYFMAAIFLALFASIGFKISALGIRMLSVGRGKDGK